MGEHKQLLYPIGGFAIILGIVLLIYDYYINEPKVTWSDPSINPYVLVFGIISLIIGIGTIAIKFFWR